MTKSLLTPSFWSPVARTSTEAVNRPHDWNVLSRPHASSTITSEPMSKILVTPIFYSSVTATKPAVENELDNFTETTTSSSSAAPSSPTLLTLSSATESTPGYNSPTVTTPVRSNSTSPTTRCRSRRAKLLLIPALPARMSAPSQLLQTSSPHLPQIARHQSSSPQPSCLHKKQLPPQLTVVAVFQSSVGLHLASNRQ
ncbi:hypothetical protein PPTG_03697 [Phytophthora nicotianae INRA-310]|uniref:Uncharacterized protein n=1 Tax=Phytophthora nicotianae (strain INRA-310) TaxID=761204 RepID=W2R6B8_PHYN3|nr:hypothetical protein PPTG_03697 [Phytophthora nicotianae INRA-310]ETN20771.1 hypothetical protein PPTG_03697 [Phytophthora nicotianae INRA-310]